MPISQKIAEMVEMLPVNEQEFAYEFVKKLVRAWDPDFTKLTPQEAAELEEAEREMAAGEFVRHEDIKWD